MRTWCCSTRPHGGPSGPRTFTTRAITRPYEGLDVEGAVRSVFVRGRGVIRDGQFVGARGAGRFVGRSGITG